MDRERKYKGGQVSLLLLAIPWCVADCEIPGTLKLGIARQAHTAYAGTSEHTCSTLPLVEGGWHRLPACLVVSSQTGQHHPACYSPGLHCIAYTILQLRPALQSLNSANISWLYWICIVH